MATTLSTKTITLANGERYTPEVVRAAEETNLTTGSTTVYAPFDTRRHQVGRITTHSKAWGSSDSTITLKVLTGPTSASVSNLVKTSTFGAIKTITPTTNANHITYVGLHDWTSVELTEAGGDAASTDISVDVELV